MVKIKYFPRKNLSQWSLIFLVCFSFISLIYYSIENIYFTLTLNIWILFTCIFPFLPLLLKVEEILFCSSTTFIYWTPFTFCSPRDESSYCFISIFWITYTGWVNVWYFKFYHFCVLLFFFLLSSKLFSSFALRYLDLVCIFYIIVSTTLFSLMKSIEKYELNSLCFVSTRKKMFCDHYRSLNRNDPFLVFFLNLYKTKNIK